MKVDGRERERNKILVLMGKQPQVPKITLPPQDINLATDWIAHCVAIAFELPEAERKPELLAQRFGRSVNEVQFYIDALLTRGILRQTPTGVIERTPGFIENSPTPLLNEQIKKFHSDSLELAHRCLEKYPHTERDFSVITFTGNRSKMDLLRDEVYKFQERLTLLMSSSEADEVFRMSVQLFPVTPQLSET